MRINKKRNRMLLLLVLLLGIGIGFAALSTTLKINGLTTVTKNSWNIYWDNVTNEKGVSTTTPTIGPDEGENINTEVTWSVVLDKPGDYYEFTVDAVNEGSLDAMITKIEKKLNGTVISENNKLPDYIKYTVTYDDGVEIGLNHLLQKADLSTNPITPTVQTYKVRVEYDSDIVTKADINGMTDDVTYHFSFAVTYGQATDDAIGYKKYVPGDLVYFDPVNQDNCDSESFDLNAIKSGTSTCYKWRVIEVNDNKFKPNITIQMDHNLVNSDAWILSSDYIYSAETSEDWNNRLWTKRGPITILKSIATKTSSWTIPALNYTYDTTAAIRNYGVLTCTNGTCKNGADETIATGVKARIITGEEIKALTLYAGATEDSIAGQWTLASVYGTYYHFSNNAIKIGTRTFVANSSTDLAWLLENIRGYTTSGATSNAYASDVYGYWTLSPISNYEDQAWYIYDDGSIRSGDHAGTPNKYGIRPVIEISKSKL